MKLELTPGEYSVLIQSIADAIAMHLVQGRQEQASQYNRLLNLLAQNTKFIDEEKED